MNIMRLASADQNVNTKTFFFCNLEHKSDKKFQWMPYALISIPLSINVFVNKRKGVYNMYELADILEC